MAIELNNSIFVHVPKTAGRTIRQALQNSTETRGIGWSWDHYGAHFPIYDGTWDKNLFDQKQCFAFIRRPEDWIRSLFYQRGRKNWNWQNNPWEQETRCSHLDVFANRWLRKSNMVYEYLRYHYTMNGLASNVMLLRFDHIVEDLTFFLDRQKEDYNKERLTKFIKEWHVGQRAAKDLPSIDRDIVKQIHENEPVLMELV